MKADCPPRSWTFGWQRKQVHQPGRAFSEPFEANPYVRVRVTEMDGLSLVGEKDSS